MRWKVFVETCVEKDGYTIEEVSVIVNAKDKQDAVEKALELLDNALGWENVATAVKSYSLPDLEKYKETE